MRASVTICVVRVRELLCARTDGDIVDDGQQCAVVTSRRASPRVGKSVSVQMSPSSTFYQHGLLLPQELVANKPETMRKRDEGENPRGADEYCRVGAEEGRCDADRCSTQKWHPCAQARNVRARWCCTGQRPCPNYGCDCWSELFCLTLTKHVQNLLTREQKSQSPVREPRIRVHHPR